MDILIANETIAMLIELLIINGNTLIGGNWGFGILLINYLINISYLITKMTRKIKNISHIIYVLP
jgi:hypothetical protein